MKLPIQGQQAIELTGDLDSTVNFKINSTLKEEFEKLCKANHTNMSRELKIFMTKAVSAQTLNTKQWFFM